ncbi:MAG: RNA polymerase sigma factor RpoD/SigA [Bacteroidales bacterium]|jgi:RNA polymerase primary sigma factor|nr:RNA polymerase sigma factor RpoD/SigA [Bacteroidales bacterium]
MRQLVITKQLTPRNEESINRYFNEISNYPMVSAEEEVELSVNIRKGDIKALDKLVLANLRFVISVAKQYQNQGLSLPDLINEGNIGLVKAARLFDASRGFKFISYAVWWIRQSIVQAISDQTRIVRLPLNRIAAINKIKKAIPYLEQLYERDPTEDEVANFLDIKNEKVETANRIKNRQVSFDVPLGGDYDDNFSLYDTVQNESISPPDKVLMNESLMINIRRALAKLSHREAAILNMSFGLDGHAAWSLQDIADKYGMSSERVRQIRNNGLSKLKLLLRDNTDFLGD